MTVSLVLLLLYASKLRTLADYLTGGETLRHVSFLRRSFLVHLILAYETKTLCVGVKCGVEY